MNASMIEELTDRQTNRQTDKLRDECSGREPRDSSKTEFGKT